MARRVRRARRRQEPPKESAVQPGRAALALPVVRPPDRRARERAARQLGRAARQVLELQGAHQHQVPRRRAARRHRRGVFGVALRPSLAALGAAIFIWFTIALAVIDQETGLLPDDLTLPLIWIGLLLNLRGAFVPIQDAVLGAVAGYLSLWLVYWAFQLAHRQGRHGLRRLQDERRGRRLSRLEDAAAGDPALVAGRPARSARRRCSPRAAAGTAASASISAPTSPIAGVIALYWGEAMMRWYMYRVLD